MSGDGLHFSRREKGRFGDAVLHGVGTRGALLFHSGPKNNKQQNVNAGVVSAKEGFLGAEERRMMGRER